LKGSVDSRYISILGKDEDTKGACGGNFSNHARATKKYNNPVRTSRVVQEEEKEIHIQDSW
jgi:hypothetical protein